MNLNEVVNKILNVINNKDRIIFFINGPMGVGKTRLSRTIVNQLN